MANVSRPHLIANERGAYLLTCKKNLAESLVAHPKRLAALTLADMRGAKGA